MSDPLRTYLHDHLVGPGAFEAWAQFAKVEDYRLRLGAHFRKKPRDGRKERCMAGKASRKERKVMAMGSSGALVGGELAAGDLGETEIAARAYELWQARGCPEGSELEDWLQAEEELRRRPMSSL